MVGLVFRNAAILLLGFVFWGAISANAPAQVAERAARGNATLVVEGTVRGVFSREVDGQADHLVQITVRRAEVTGSAPAGVRFPAPGEPVYVNVPPQRRSGLFRRGESPRLPSEGADVRVFLAVAPEGGWKAASSDWLESLSADGRANESSRSTERDVTRDRAARGEALGMTFDVIEVRGKLAFRVTKLAENGPASRAGLEVGDVIVGYMNRDIASVDEFKQVANSIARINLSVIDVNSGRIAQVNVTTGSPNASEAATDRPRVNDKPSRTTQERPISLGISAERVSVGFRSALKVTSVAPDSPAAKAGLEKGDILVKANGVSLTGPEQLVAVLRKSPGKLVLTVRDVRTGRDVPVNVDLGGADTPTADRTPSPKREPAGEANDLGVVSELAFYDVEAAVKITEVERGSPADRAGLEVGMLVLEANGQPILHPNDLTDAARTNTRLRLTVVDPRSGRKGAVDVDFSRRR